MASRLGKIIIMSALPILLAADREQTPLLDDLSQPKRFKTDFSDWPLRDPAFLPTLTDGSPRNSLDKELPEHSMVPLPSAVAGAGTLGIAWLVRRGYKTALKIKRNRRRII